MKKFNIYIFILLVSIAFLATELGFLMLDGIIRFTLTVLGVLCVLSGIIVICRYSKHIREFLIAFLDNLFF